MVSLLEIRDLRVVYPNGHEALRSVSMKAEPGEIVAIVGRSGAGKSTLLRCINGLQRTASGSIILDGQEITSMDESQLRVARRKIGFVWQEYNLVDRLPVITNVLTGRLGYNDGLTGLLGYFNTKHREIAVRNLSRVSLLHRANQRADRLSGGEKQRAAIARAITQQPTIVLADEPVSSLDPELSRQVIHDLSTVARADGVLTLISIHQVNLAKSFVDRIVGIADGTVVFDGPPSRLDDEAMNLIYRSGHPAVVADCVEPLALAAV